MTSTRRHNNLRWGYPILVCVPIAASTIAVPLRDAEGCDGGPIAGWEVENIDIPDFTSVDKSVVFLRAQTFLTDPSTALASLVVTVTDESETELPGQLEVRASDNKDIDKAFDQWTIIWRPDIPLQDGVNYKVQAHGESSSTWNATFGPWPLQASIAHIPSPDFLEPIFSHLSRGTGLDTKCTTLYDCDPYGHLFPIAEEFDPAVRLEVKQGYDTHAILYEVLVQQLDPRGLPTEGLRIWHPFNPPYSLSIPFAASARHYCIRAWLRSMDGADVGETRDYCVDHDPCGFIDSDRANALSVCDSPPEAPEALPGWCGYHPNHAACVGVTAEPPLPTCLEGQGGAAGGAGTAGTSGAEGGTGTGGSGPSGTSGTGAGGTSALTGGVAGSAGNTGEPALAARQPVSGESCSLGTRNSITGSPETSWMMTMLVGALRKARRKRNPS